ncbi:peptidase T [Lysinibacillus sp. OL1_EC]|uniref:peptidase T n=1 Tax=unclassified Lysinibacillus TaxID=2636778 RepID=UPI001039FCAF|nr:MULTISPECIES: peptidase T [unclassified Lysinibacillus]MCM0624557.1 peptidase T [Lysinibacillus sp. OL1_EC]MCS5501777.1 peptidase T [Lysinibacillus sp. A4]TBV87898.1 peptidase T [Lysinibacillus sp. OL1]UKJ45794.1 peptidase T [Lysinibacillus sp. ACHW1.5]WGT39196.1 peptidase T [Lysinibacillus sp. 1 U-2021]
MKEQVIERLIRYAKIDTQSDFTSETTPSTQKQFDLLHVLKDELAEIGLTDITLDENGYLFASLEANTDKEVPTIGFLAHVDTATDYTGTNVKPQRVDNYDGGDIQLNENLVMSPTDFPELKNYVGQTLITTDGTTLLGADDKAGIAEIMTAMEYLIKNPTIKHGKIRVAFTPDEEIGRGPHKFDVATFGADYAYTMDGGPLGELQFESFNAAGVKVITKGTSVHPGSAKNKMVNAITMAIAFQNEMPADAVPEKTEGYEGFIHLMSFKGALEHTELSYIVRDHDRQKFEEKKQLMRDAAAKIQAQFGEHALSITIEDQYYNMGEKIEPVKEIVDIARTAMEKLDITPNTLPIRGGTDGSQLSYMGLPTPNIFAGGENMHGKFEYVSAETMEKATQVIIEIVQLFEQQAK